MLKNRANRENAETINRALNLEFLECRVLLSAATQIVALPQLKITPQASGSSVQGYTPQEISAAYGFNQINFNGVTGDGNGQTIAIVDAFNDPNIAGDLSTFDKQFDLPSASLTKVSQTGSTTALPTTDAGWATEISLDVEWAHAIAPDANILLVETKSDSLTDLLAGVNYARNAAGVSVVSLSWGSSEFFQESRYDSDFTTPAGHQGVTFVAASGDEGSWSGPSWPASSSNVLAVGGTTLNLTSTNTISSETGWSDSTGGFSRYEPEPAYQQIAQFSGGKSSPDVAYDANPNTGFAVYDSVSFEGDSGWQVYGGTSAGTPQWGALVAIADQGRTLNGAGTLDGATGTLPTLYSLYTAASYFNNFNDVTAGRSSFFTSARPGYDLITGLGSPQANQVVQVLVGATTGSFSTAQVKRTIAKAAVRAQTVKLVAATQEQQQNQTVTNSSTHQPVVEIQNITRHDAPIGITENKSESLSINESVANIRVMSDRRVAFHTASALVSEQSTNDAPIVGQFKFSHKSIRSTDHNAEIPHDAIALHDSAMEAGMLAVKENDESATWKQLACLVGAGVVIGTYSAKVRRQKRIIGTP